MFASRLWTLRPLLLRRPLWQGLLRPLAGAAALLFLMADDGISSDELACEIAVTQLARCCPALAIDKISCVHGGCDSAILPDIDEGRGQCIQQRSCDELQRLGACEPGLWELHPRCLAMGTSNPTCQILVPPCR
ncbi:MAG: hypothetical protein JNJ46_08090 [Myxococcales bacterium]|nr:hypothetical protein [Myxococcales bacterium]